MKHIKSVGLAITLLCFTSLLIAAFMVLFSNYGYSSKKKSKEKITINIGSVH